MNKLAQKSGRPPVGRNVLGRVIRMLFRAYPVLIPLTAFCILFSAGISAVPAIFQQKVFAVIENALSTNTMDWELVRIEILPLVSVLVLLYVLSILSITLYTQLMAYITQGFLDKMRCQMFGGMQSLPIRYFDTNKHGDIMSYYTNDIDALRQLVSQ